MENTIIYTFFKYVTANILGMIGLSCYILADTFFVSRGLGADGLAALNIAIPVFSFINGTGLMLGIGSGTRYSILKPQKEDQKANMIFTHGIIMGVISGFVFLLIGLFASTSLSRLLGANVNILALTETYIKTILCFAPFFILNNIMVALVRNDGNPKLSMMGMLIGSLSNIILDYIFIFPMNMGMFGAAFATCLAPIISILILSVHFISKNNQFHLIKCKIQFPKILDIFKLGLSSFTTEISSGIVLIVFNLIILGIEGNLGVAAYGIVANLALVALSIYTGIAQGIQPLVSKYHGFSDSKAIRKVLKYSVALSLVISMILYIIVFVFHQNIVAVFNRDHITLLEEIASKGLLIYFIGFMFAGLNVILAAFLSATEKPLTGLMISLARGLIIIIPMALILSHFFGMEGVWMTFTCTEFITCFITLYGVKKFIK